MRVQRSLRKLALYKETSASILNFPANRLHGPVHQSTIHVRQVTRTLESTMFDDIMPIATSLLKDTCVSNLQRLPVELLLIVLDFLDDTSSVCLKYSSRYFRATFNIVIQTLDPCTR